MPKIILALAPILLMNVHSAQAETAPWWVGDGPASEHCREPHPAREQAAVVSCPDTAAPVVSIAVSEAPASVSDTTKGLLHRHAELDYALAEAGVGGAMKADGELDAPEEETRALVVADEVFESTDLGPPEPDDPRLHPDEDVRGRGPVRFCRLETCAPQED